MSDKPFVELPADALQIEAGILFFLDEFSIPARVEFMNFIRDGAQVGGLRDLPGPHSPPGRRPA
jgi:hypothetical protein